MIFVKVITKNASMRRSEIKPANLLLKCDFDEILEKLMLGNKLNFFKNAGIAFFNYFIALILGSKKFHLNLSLKFSSFCFIHLCLSKIRTSITFF